MMNKLHIRLLTSFILLVILPIIVAGSFVAFQTRTIQIKQARKIQEQMAQRVDSEFLNYIKNHEKALLQLIKVRGLLNLKPDDRKQILEEMLAFENEFEELILLDENGNVQAQYHSYRIFTQNELKNRRNITAFFNSKSKGTTYFGPVHFNDEIGEPLMQIVVPFYNIKSNSLKGVLVSELRLKPIWDLLAGLPSTIGQQVYILDSKNRVIAHPNPSIVLRGTNFFLKEAIFSNGLNNTPSIIAYKNVQLGDRKFTVVAELSKKEALRVADQILHLLLFVGILALIMITILMVLLLKQFVRPINHLVDVAHAIKQGDMDCRAQIDSKDEVGELAHSFNEMTDKLKYSLQNLKREVAEREQAQKELIKKEDSYRKTIESSIDGFWMLDKNGNFLNVNDAYSRMSGYSRDELLCMSIRDVTVLESQPQIDTHMQKIMQGKKNRFESKHRHKNGHFFYVEVSANYTSKGSGMFFVFLRDITDRKKTEKEKRKFETKLQQAQKMESIGTLAGGIAHDFNNILFPIIGYTEMLLEDVPTNSPFREGLNHIYTGALRASELVKQILTFSRQKSSELKLMKMQPIIKEALKLIRSSIPTTIEIKQNLQPDCGVIKADPTQIHQIIMNLCTNAYHAMEDTGGKLIVSLKEIKLGQHDVIAPEMIPGAYACLTISDTGIGMDKRLIETIFDPFFTTKEQGKGTGMGLSVVHGIIKSTGGAIQVYSELGKGTKFKVYLPVVKSSCEQQENHQIKDPIQGGSERILLVDDEEAIITMEKMMLERLGYQVTSLTSSIEALEVFRDHSNKFDLVITDMQMPNMPGDKLSIELNKIRPDVPVLLCTGFSEITPEQKAVSLGIKGFLLKPIVMKDLSQKIREMLNENKN